MDQLQPHPLEILVRNAAALKNWSHGQRSGESSQALGALGEILAAIHLKADIVSHETNCYDLVAGSTRIEVKTNGGRMSGSKDCVLVARVEVAASAGGGVSVESISTRPHPDPADGHSHWTRLPNFKSFRVL